MVLRFIIFLVQMIRGSLAYQEAKDYLNEDSQEVTDYEKFFNVTQVQSIYPFAKWIIIFGETIRVVLILISYEKPAIVKSYVHFDMVMLIFVNCMPNYLKIYDRSYVTVLETAIILFCVYFTFKSSAISLLINRIFYCLIQFLIYEESFHDIVKVFAWSSLQCLVVLCFVHITVSYVGYLYIEHEILPNEMEQLLSTMDQGIILVDQTTKQPVFQNKQA